VTNVETTLFHSGLWNLQRMSASGVFYMIIWHDPSEITAEEITCLSSSAAVSAMWPIIQQCGRLLSWSVPP
jgi:hypothetical protein